MDNIGQQHSINILNIETVYISEQLRQANIAEYLLYMWQVEDTIRAYDLDIE